MTNANYQQRRQSPFIIILPIWAWLLVGVFAIVWYPIVVLLRLLFRSIGATQGNVTVPSMDRPWWNKPEAVETEQWHPSKPDES